MKTTCAIFLASSALAGLAAPSVHAYELYHWVDEQGVKHFSQFKPGEKSTSFETLTVEDSTPSDYNPEEDRYNIKAQEEAMQALWDEREQKLEDFRYRQDASRPVPATVQQPAQAYDVSPWTFPAYGARPPGSRPPGQRPPNPPSRPERPPAPDLEDSSPFKPPGGNARRNNR